MLNSDINKVLTTTFGFISKYDANDSLKVRQEEGLTFFCKDGLEPGFPIQLIPDKGYL